MLEFALSFPIPSAINTPFAILFPFDAETLQSSTAILDFLQILFDESNELLIAIPGDVERLLQLDLPAGEPQPRFCAAPKAEKLRQLEIVDVVSKMLSSGLVGVEAFAVAAHVKQAVAVLFVDVGDERVDAEGVDDPLDDVTPFFLQLVRVGARTTADGRAGPSSQVAHEELRSDFMEGQINHW